VTGGEGRVVVLYDGECGFCAWALAWLLRWDGAKRLRAQSIQSEEGARVLAGMPAEQRLSSWHAAEPGGPLRSAGAAFPIVLDRLPGGRPLAALARTYPRASERAYRIVADHRAGLGRIVPSSSKRRARVLIAARMH
jgi:predicted DCC family thiol-disulfide oxidoreductase YuxK